MENKYRNNVEREVSVRYRDIEIDIGSHRCGMNSVYYISEVSTPGEIGRSCYMEVYDYKQMPIKTIDGDVQEMVFAIQENPWPLSPRCSTLEYEFKPSYIVRASDEADLLIKLGESLYKKRQDGINRSKANGYYVKEC